MKFELTILGSSAGLPAFNRFTTSQILNVQEQHYMIDCGEGTQMRLEQYSIPRGRIKQIFISHLHGDHINGLVGLLTSYSMVGRTEAISVFAPAGLKQLIDFQLHTTSSHITYPVTFYEIDTTQHKLIFEDKLVTVHSIPLDHRVPTAGFLFREKPRPNNIIPKKIEEYNIPFFQISEIKSGMDFVTRDGITIPNNQLTSPPPAPRSYAYCSDTLYTKCIIPIIEKVNLLFHETTFCHDMLENTTLSKHTTARQAAELATAAQVGQLITGHYSARYPNIEPILNEARHYFENSVAGLDGSVHEVLWKKKDVPSVIFPK